MGGSQSNIKKALDEVEAKTCWKNGLIVDINGRGRYQVININPINSINSINTDDKVFKYHYVGDKIIISERNPAGYVITLEKIVDQKIGGFRKHDAINVNRRIGRVKSEMNNEMNNEAVNEVVNEQKVARNTHNTHNTQNTHNTHNAHNTHNIKKHELGDDNAGTANTEDNVLKDQINEVTEGQHNRISAHIRQNMYKNNAEQRNIFSSIDGSPPDVTF